MRCKEGDELRTAENIKKEFCGEDEVFFFTYERVRRYEGEWHSEKVPLFPGTIFFRFPDEKAAESRERELFLQASPEVGQALAKLAEEGCHIPMSKGYIENGVTYVTEGPLKAKETAISKIDRHKRLAQINNPAAVFCQKGLWMGLEIVSKS